MCIMHTTCMPGDLDHQEGIRAPGRGVKDSCRLPCGWLGMKPGSTEGTVRALNY